MKREAFNRNLSATESRCRVLQYQLWVKSISREKFGNNKKQTEIINGAPTGTYERSIN
jgi:hypothetical protein